MLESMAKSEWISESWRVFDMRASSILSTNNVLCDPIQNVAGWRQPPRQLLNMFKISSQCDEARGTFFCLPTSEEPWLHPLSLPLEKWRPQSAKRCHSKQEKVVIAIHHAAPTRPPFFLLEDSLRRRYPLGFSGIDLIKRSD